VSLLWALGGLALALVALALFVATRPSAFRIARSATVEAEPGAVFAHVNALRKWDAWSPWAKRDPAMKQTWDGPPEGVGASTHWEGNRQVGEGRMEIVESRPAALVRIRLEFLKPFAATNTAEFVFEPEGAATRVTWAMTGDNNFMAKAVGLVMNMDRMVGRDFEQGLASLKAVVEKGTAP